ncbi:host specificity factor TipJ family phage tail protein [Lichenihabitans psoromatis]|uniref:host specificity factor TipJ family phage tail protein n=1 Tax=Lichenihabitans psoromatis TaxID=2528642 RepID=UPI0010384E25|nr:host specificity factor TipJ family phage tail protein [Lichenihabitans psoromatis]
MTRPLRTIERRHAFTGTRIAVARPIKGDTIRAFVTREGLTAGLPTIVVARVRGELRPVMQADWDRPIRTRDRLVLLSAPQGGGGAGGGGGGSGQVGSIVGLVALLAIAGPLGGGAALAGLVGHGLTAGLASAFIVGGGSILLSHFLGAGRPKADAPEYSINITSNQARSQQPVPGHYGRLKFLPDLAAPIYTDYSGIVQVLHGLYSLGVGSFDLEEIGIGAEAMWTATDGVLDAFEGSLKIEHVEPDANCTLFPVNVYTAPDVTGQTMPDPYGTKYPDGSVSIGPNGEGQVNAGGPHTLGPFIAVPPGETAINFAVDFIWPSGLYKIGGSSGQQKSADCEIELFYQYIDDQGHPLANPVKILDKTYVYNSKVAVRVTEQFSIPTAGRIQVFAARIVLQSRTEYTDTVTWAGLKAYVIGPNAVPYASRLAIQLVADNQVSSVSTQQIYVIATRKIPVYDAGTGQFVVEATRNPIWAALDVWHNADYGGNLPLDHIDLPTFVSLAAAADTRGDTFNYRFTAQMTVLEAIETCLRPMLTTAVYLGDRLSAVRDEPRGFPSLVLTDFEIQRGSLDIGYTLKDAQTSDGVILQYIDEETWKSAEVTSREPGVILLQPTRITQNGNTNRRQATDVARYHAAVNNYRRKTVTLTVEGDGYVARRGALVSVTSELPQTWGQSLRVEAIDSVNDILTTSAPGDWSASGSYYVKIRQPGAGVFGPVACRRGDNDNAIVLDAADRARVEQQLGISWLDAASRDPLEEPASLELGVGTSIAFEGLVNVITRGDREDLFKLELVLDAPEVYARDGAIDPLPTPSPLVLLKFPGAIAGLNAYLKQSGTSIMLYASWNPEPVSVSYTAQISYDGKSWQVVYADGDLCGFSAGPVAPSDCLFRIRGKAANGASGPWSQISLTSPDLTLSPASLGYGVGFDDLLPGLLDAVTFAPLQALSDGIDALAIIKQTVLDPLSAVTALTPVQQQINLAANAVTIEQYERVEADTAIVGYAIGVQANVDTNQASVLQQFEAQADTNQAVATAITTVKAATDTNAASIVSETQARTTADSATASRLDALTATVGGNTAAITSESQTRATADSATATQLTGLTATVGGNTAAISIESQTRATVDSATATRLDTLSASVGGNTAAITTESQTRATVDTATATRLDALSVSVGTNTATATSIQQAYTTADAAISSRIDTLGTTVGGNSAAISSEAQARANGDSAVAARVDSLSTTVGGNMANISTLQASSNGVSVQYGVIGTIDGQTGGFIFTGVRRLDGSVAYNMAIKGDVMVDGTLSATKIVDLSIGNSKIAGSAISNSVFTQRGDTNDTVSAQITVDDGAVLSVNFSAQISSTLGSGANNTDYIAVIYHYYLDGTQIYSALVFQSKTGVLLLNTGKEIQFGVAAGTHTIDCQIEIQRQGGVVQVSNLTSSIQALKR